MKSKILLVTAPLLVLALVAWSPPNAEDVVVGTTSMTSPTGQIAVVGTGSAGKATRSLIVGTDHQVSTGPSQYARSGSIVSGSANTVDANQTIVSGFNNLVQSVTSTETRSSLVAGGNNALLNARGYIVGFTNQVAGDYGVAIGHDNDVTGTYANTFGNGLKASNWRSSALGRYNAPMASTDVLVVGSGGADNARFTALRVTDDGGVYLGRPQGDISMGAYNN